MGSRGNGVGERWNEMGCEEKSSVIQDEIKRASKLPSNSVYAVHRLKVLNKINQLLSVQRTLSQEKELELLFTQLSLGIWYVLTLLSLFGLSISLNLLWPPGDSSSLSRFLRDGAVSATTFYAVTLLKYLFFNDPPSTCYNEFTTPDERLPQAVFSEIAMSLVFTLPIYYSVLFKTNNNLFSLFCISLFTGGIGLIQLSDKFRMETRHAFLTLFLDWLFGLLATFEALYCNDHHGQAWCIGIALLYEFLSLGLFFYNFPDTLSTSRLPA